MRVLVTGGAGYIGSHTIRTLTKQGHEPVVYDDFSTGHKTSVKGYDCIVADIANQEKLRVALRGVDAVMHFAAFSCVPESATNPQKYFENNVGSGLALLRSVLEAGISYFIFSSTCAVYGLPSQIPISENTPRIPINPYGASKLCFENALEAYHAAYGLRFVCLRYFNAAGAAENGDIGELHEPETHLIPRALEAAMNGTELDVYGSDYPTVDGTCIRDYIDVSDLAEAHVLALGHLADGGPSGVFNLGTGSGHSVLEVLSTVEQITGRFCTRRPGDPAVLIADSARAMRTLNWQPQRSLRDMVATAWKFMQAHQQTSLQLH